MLKAVTLSVVCGFELVLKLCSFDNALINLEKGLMIYIYYEAAAGHVGINKGYDVGSYSKHVLYMDAIGTCSCVLI